MKYIVIVIAFVVLSLGIFIGLSSSLKKPKQTIKASAKTATASNIGPLELYPSAPLSCSNSASLVQATIDYIVTDMNCSKPGQPSNPSVICNGTIMEHAANVSLICYPANHYSVANSMQCRGTTNSSANPTNLTLNYSCFIPSVSINMIIYNCSGYLSNFSSLAINLPISVTCGA